MLVWYSKQGIDLKGYGSCLSKSVYVSPKFRWMKIEEMESRDILEVECEILLWLTNQKEIGL